MRRKASNQLARTLLGIIALGFVCTRVRSQTLDFGSRTDPDFSRGSGGAAVVQRLGQRAEELEHSGDSRAQLLGEVAQTASALILLGEDLGRSGSTHVLLGMSLADDLPKIEGRLALVDDAPAILAAWALLREARASLPSDPRSAVATVRLAISPIAEQVGLCTSELGDGDGDQGTPAPPTTISPAELWISAFDSRPDADSLRASIDAWVGLVNAGQANAGLGFAADELARNLRSARAAAEFDASWLVRGARERLANAFAGALSVSQNTGAPDPAKMSRLGDLHRALIDVPLVTGSGAGSRAAADAIVELLLSDYEQSGVGGFEDAFALCAAVGSRLAHMPKERELIQQLRPAWRSLDINAKRELGVLRDALVRSGASAPVDPAFIAQHGSANEAITDIESLARLSEVLRVRDLPDQPAKEAALDPAWSRLGVPLLRSGQALSRRNANADALLEHRASVARALRFADAGSERAYQAARAAGGEEVWVRVSGGRVEELVKARSLARESWLAACSREGAVVDSKTLGFLCEALDRAHDAVRIEALAPQGLVGDGWSIAEPASADLSTRLKASVASLCNVLLVGDDAASSRALEQFAGEQAAALLLLAHASNDADSLVTCAVFRAGDRAVIDVARGVREWHESRDERFLTWCNAAARRAPAR